MSTVTYTPTAAGSTLKTIPLDTPEVQPPQQTSCAQITTQNDLATSAVDLKVRNFPYLASNPKSTLLKFQTALQQADIPENTQLTVSLGAVVTSYLTSLENTIIPIQQYAANCVNDYYEFNSEDYEAHVKATDESKSRLDAITTPEQHVSYYDGWFPLFRPMKESALFGLFAVSIFMLLLSVLVFLRMKGIEINIILPQGSIDLSWMTTYIPYGGIGIGIGFAVAYILYKYYPSAIGM
jgi:hypothetical protein